VLVFAAGCVTSENFTPAERATAISPEGYTAADYELVAEGEHLGDAMVWSNGAYERDGDTVVHVGFQIENVTDTPIELNSDDVQIRVQAEDTTVSVEGPTLVSGSTVIPPGTERTAALFFELPAGISPDDVYAFRVSWAAHSGSLEYEQRTPFMEYDEPALIDPYYRGGYYGSAFYYTPFYDPFVFSPFNYRPLISRPGPYRYRNYQPSASR